MPSLRFDYIQAGVRYVLGDGTFTQNFRTWWQEIVDGLDEALGVASPVTVTAATLAVVPGSHHSKSTVLDRAAGIAVTLPAATGSGAKYRFIVKTTITSNTTTIKVTGNDVMQGLATLAQDAADTAVTFEAAVDSDTVTFNGTTTGGLAGADVTLEDIALDTWWVHVRSAATGVEATPFSATV